MQVEISRDGEEIGSYPAEKIPELVAAQILRPTDYGWYEGQPEWRSLSELFPSRPTTQASGTPPVALTQSPPPPETPGDMGYPNDPRQCYVRIEGKSKRLQNSREIEGLLIQGQIGPLTCVWIPDQGKWQTIGEWLPDLFAEFEFRRNGEPLGDFTAVAAHHEIVEGRIKKSDRVRPSGQRKWVKVGELETFNGSFKERESIYFTGGCFLPLLLAALVAVLGRGLQGVLGDNLPEWYDMAYFVLTGCLLLAGLNWGWDSFSRARKIIRCPECNSGRTIILDNADTGQYVTEVPTIGLVWDPRKHEQVMGVKNVVTTMALSEADCYCPGCGHRWTQQIKTDLGAKDRIPFS